MRDFMRQQITDSIKWDCGTARAAPVKKTGQQWCEAEHGRLLHDIAYHDKHYAEEMQRAKERTEWVAALRRSLEPTHP